MSRGLTQATEKDSPVRCNVPYDARRRLCCHRRRRLCCHRRSWSHFGHLDRRTAVAALKSHALVSTAKLNNPALGFAAFATEWSNHDKNLPDPFALLVLTSVAHWALPATLEGHWGQQYQGTPQCSEFNEICGVGTTSDTRQRCHGTSLRSRASLIANAASAPRRGCLRNHWRMRCHASLTMSRERLYSTTFNSFSLVALPTVTSTLRT